MKILFVDQSDDLQQKWIEPLRKKGWAVLRARSAEDATRMAFLHGEALEAVVVGERFAGWAEKQEYPFVILTSTWSETDIMKHQNSDTSAVAYLPYARACEELHALFEASQHTGQLKATGTTGRPIPTSSSARRGGLALEDYSKILAKPELTIAGGFQLDAPTIALGGKQPTQASAIKAPPVAENDQPEPTRIFSAGGGSTPAVSAVEMVQEQPDPTRIFGLTSPAPAPASTPDPVDTAEPTRIFDAGSSSANTNRPEVEEMTIEPTTVNRTVMLDSTSGMDFSVLPEMVSPPPPPVPSHQLAPGYSTPVVNQFSINPSPSGQVTDSETLRSYLALREQDVAVLSGQVRSSQERIQQLEMILKMEKARNTELSHLVSRQEQTIKNYDQEKQVELEVLANQVDDMERQLKERTDKTRVIETKLRMTLDEVSKVKERVRVDIRRIRVREKELESQLEVLKKDSSALLQARDEKILELKRKLDLLEFNMELVQEQFHKEKRTADDLKGKLKDAAQVMKQANGLLEQ